MKLTLHEIARLLALNVWPMKMLPLTKLSLIAVRLRATSVMDQNSL